MYRLSCRIGGLRTVRAGEIVVSRLALSFGTMSLLGVLMFGCKPAGQSGIPGKYVADYDLAREEVTLDANGTFTQKVVFKATSKVDTSKGKWSYEPEISYLRFDEHFMLVTDGFRHFRPDYDKPNGGDTLLPNNRRFGSASFGTEEGVLWVKCEPAPASPKGSASESNDTAKQKER